jgi:nuclear respiratory factor 1
MVTIMNTSSGDSLAIAVGTSSSSINHMVSDDDDGCPSSPGSAQFDEGGDLMAAAMGDEVTAQLAAAGWQNEHGDFTLLCFCFIL